MRPVDCLLLLAIISFTGLTWLTVPMRSGCASQNLNRLIRMSPVALIVHNTLGQEVATLVHGELEAEPHEIRFDASRLASGMYICTLSAETNAVTKQ